MRCPMLPLQAAVVRRGLRDDLPRPATAFLVASSLRGGGLSADLLSDFVGYLLRLRIGGGVGGAADGVVLFADGPEPEDEYTATATGWAVGTLAILAGEVSLGHHLPGVRRSLRDAARLLRTAGPAGAGLASLGGPADGGVRATSLVLAGALRLSRAIDSPIDLPLSSSAPLLQFLLGRATCLAKVSRGGADLAAAADVADAVAAAERILPFPPPAVVLTTPRVQAGPAARIRVRVTSAVGMPVPAQVGLVGTGKRSAGWIGRVDVPAVHLEDGSAEHELRLGDIDGLDGPGEYVLEVTAALLGAGAPASSHGRGAGWGGGAGDVPGLADSAAAAAAAAVQVEARRALVVSAGVRAVSAELRVEGSSDEAAAGRRASAQGGPGVNPASAPAAAATAVRASGNDTVVFTADLRFLGTSPGSQFRPQQAVFLLRPCSGSAGSGAGADAGALAASGSAEAAVAVKAEPSHVTPGSWEGRLRLGAAPAGALSAGRYDVELLVGDRLLTSPLRWRFAAVEVSSPGRLPEAAAPLEGSDWALPGADRDPFASLPEAGQAASLGPGAAAEGGAAEEDGALGVAAAATAAVAVVVAVGAVVWRASLGVVAGPWRFAIHTVLPFVLVAALPAAKWVYGADAVRLAGAVTVPVMVALLVGDALVAGPSADRE
ncbi:hypothetical protein FNF29_01014 [Cafeteria roenbergensis]|uniref:Uncharacterized protein n=1 Tax=Cafeteria roenbergensis TaxID=33653 RepID=A0A5A8CUV2_CAFRO|nr:hypothetical protein FNF29_01014 [Cafeteria roenbergensis]|eukprot:KAA0156224.1 hypothetical protein FNF29_01014 [Cafeteria roenbergensis]